MFVGEEPERGVSDREWRAFPLSNLFNFLSFIITMSHISL